MNTFRFLAKFSPAHRVNNLQLFVHQHIVWKQAVSFIERESYIANGKESKITFDWGNAIEILDELESFYLAGQRGDADTYEKMSKKLFPAMFEGHYDINLTCNVATDENNAAHFIEQFLRLLYLSVNLTEPGSGGMFARISPVGEPNERLKEGSVSISSEPFEYVESSAIKFDFPPFRNLSFADTWNWLDVIGIKNQSIAETNTQRAVCALLNSCLIESFLYPDGLLWLILGLEALYDLPSMGIASALRERIFLVLGVPKNSTKIKRLITDSYAMRSKFVHGRMEIINPLVGTANITNEITNKYEVPIWDSSNFARAVLVSTLQKMISEGWTNLSFETSFSGTK